MLHTCSLLRCNNHTLKKKHVNRHHHAASQLAAVAGDISAKAIWAQQSLQWMLVKVKSYLPLVLSPLMTLKETVPTGLPQHN